MWNTDRLLGGIVICLSAIVFWGCLAIDTPPATTHLSPRFFPMLFAALLALLGGALLVQNAGKPLSAALCAASRPQSLGLVLLVLLYTATFGLLDYRVSTTLFLVACLTLLKATRRETLIFPLAAACGLYALFRYGFMVLLPVWW